MGLWRVDSSGGGIAWDFPDNGFGGGCVRFSGEGEGEGLVRLESQIVRQRFDSLALTVNGQLEPQLVHVQIQVKNKALWVGDSFKFEEQPVAVPLAGQEFVIEASRQGGAAAPWTLSLCGLTLANERFSLRFTSDCAGYDLEEKTGRIAIVADEDWVALKRPIVGGMALGEVAGLWGNEPLNLTATTNFPGQLFHTALAMNEKPLVQPLPGHPATWSFGGEAGELQFAVKAKEPVVGQLDWRATLSWTGPERAAGEDGGATAPEAQPEEGASDVASASGGSGGGCAAGAGRNGVAGWLLALALLALMVGGRLKPERRRHSGEEKSA